jgi:hypothetical protein
MVPDTLLWLKQSARGQKNLGHNQISRSAG